MTYYGSKELAASFRVVRGNTIQIAEEIPENKYDFRAAPDCRTVAQTLVHVSFISALQLHMHRNRIADLNGFNFMEFFQPIMAEEGKPRTKAEIVALLRSRGDEFTSYLDSLSDAFLGEPVTQPAGAQPAVKSRFEMLLSAKEHEMHHRGQLMMVERMVGVTPHLTRQMQERMAQHAAAAQARR
jgi:uncharacterized damage-inducible protein DinB